MLAAVGLANVAEGIVGAALWLGVEFGDVIAHGGLDRALADPRDDPRPRHPHARARLRRYGDQPSFLQALGDDLEEYDQDSAATPPAPDPTTRPSPRCTTGSS